MIILATVSLTCAAIPYRALSSEVNYIQPCPIDRTDRISMIGMIVDPDVERIDASGGRRLAVLRIKAIDKGSPADIAGLIEGDDIYQLTHARSQQPFVIFQSHSILDRLERTLNELVGQEVTFEVLRVGEGFRGYGKNLKIALRVPLSCKRATSKAAMGEAWIHYDRAIDLNAKDDTVGARDAIQEAIRLNSTEATFHEWLGTSYSNGTPAEHNLGVAEYNEAIRLAEGDDQRRRLFQLYRALVLKPQLEAQKQLEAKQAEERNAERLSRAAAAAEARKRREDREALVQAEAKSRFMVFLQRHKAEDLSGNNAMKFYQNPFAYQDKHVFISGGYHSNIGPRQAIVAILPAQDPTTYVIQMDTSRNLAEGHPFIQCVVKVLGTTLVKQGIEERKIPHVREIECLLPSS